VASRMRPDFGWRLVIAAKRLVLFAALWLVLSGAALDGLAFGLPTAIAATWLSLRLLPPGRRGVSLLSLLPLVPGFLDRSVRGGFDVAWRALHPRLPIRPAWYVHRTSLPEGGARVALGSIVSLLPGTLVAGSFGDRLFVHCLNADPTVIAAVQAEERRIAGTLHETGSRSPEGRAAP
jgi:multicomponent Na+:H+ antiporter subunit E